MQFTVEQFPACDYGIRAWDVNGILKDQQNPKDEQNMKNDSKMNGFKNELCFVWPFDLFDDCLRQYCGLSLSLPRSLSDRG